MNLHEIKNITRKQNVLWMHLFISLIISIVSAKGHSQGTNIKENVYVHVNTQTLLSGETLEYSAYCFSKKTGKVSRLSKFLYVELIGQNGAVFRQKILLKDGSGHGEYFVNTQLSTGSYYLIAYTRWMKNFGDYNQTPMSIINPFEGYTEPQENDSKDPIFSFRIHGENLIGDVKNTGVFHIQKNGAIVNKYRLIASDGTPLTKLLPDEMGIGRIQFTPKYGIDYKVLLELEGQGFKYFDLPEVKKFGAVIEVVHNEKFLTIEPMMHLKNGDIEASWEIVSNDSVVFQKKTQGGTLTQIPRIKLPEGILWITLKGKRDSILSVRPMFNYEPNSEDSGLSIGTRETVQITEPLEEGKYSVSIRKKNVWSNDYQNHVMFMDMPFNSVFSRLAFSDFENIEDRILLNAKSDALDIDEHVSLLPEHRGELIQGKLQSVDSSQTSGKVVTLSIPGQQTNLSTTITDENGDFLMQYSSGSKVLEAYLTVNDFEHGYEISVEDNFSDGMFSLDFNRIKLDSFQISELVQRSIRNQIENAYFESGHQIKESSKLYSVFEEFDGHFVLDDYARFRTLKEHFVEYIPFAKVRENKNQVFNIVPRYNNQQMELTSLILLNGVPVDGRELLNFSPYRIKSIDVINTRVFMDSLTVDGVVSLQTFEKDFGGFKKFKNTKKLDLIGVQNDHNPIPYSATSINNRLPDQREQLLWIPFLQIDESGSKQIEFSSSDVLGDYEMRIEGFTKKGFPISISREFKVQQKHF